MKDALWETAEGLGLAATSIGSWAAKQPGALWRDPLGTVKSWGGIVKETPHFAMRVAGSLADELYQAVFFKGPAEERFRRIGKLGTTVAGLFVSGGTSGAVKGAAVAAKASTVVRHGTERSSGDREDLARGMVSAMGSTGQEEYDYLVGELLKLPEPILRLAAAQGVEFTASRDNAGDVMLIPGADRALGLYHPLAKMIIVGVDETEMRGSPLRAHADMTAVAELAHAIDFDGKLWPFGHGRFSGQESFQQAREADWDALFSDETASGSTGPVETFMHAYMMWVTQPDYLRRTRPHLYEEMQRIMQDDPYEIASGELRDAHGNVVRKWDDVDGDLHRDWTYAAKNRYDDEGRITAQQGWNYDGDGRLQSVDVDTDGDGTPEVRYSYEWSPQGDWAHRVHQAYEVSTTRETLLDEDGAERGGYVYDAAVIPEWSDGGVERRVLSGQIVDPDTGELLEP